MSNRRLRTTSLTLAGLLIFGGLAYVGYKKSGHPMDGLAGGPGAHAERKSITLELLHARLRDKKFAEMKEDWKDESRRNQDLIFLQNLPFAEYPGLAANPEFQNLLFWDLEADKPSMRNEQLAVRLLGRMDQGSQALRIQAAYAKQKRMEDSSLYYLFQGTVPYPVDLERKIEKVMIGQDVALSRDMLLLAQQMRDEKAQVQILSAWARDFDKIFKPMQPYVFKALSENHSSAALFRKDKKLWSKRLAAGKGALWQELREPGWQSQLSATSNTP